MLLPNISDLSDKRVRIHRQGEQRRQERTPGAPGAAAEMRGKHVGIVQGVQDVHAGSRP